MENADLIILTTVIGITFIVFVITTVREFNNVDNKSYLYKNKSKLSLFNLLGSLLDGKKISKNKKKRVRKILEGTISDMEDQGVYFKK